MGRKILHNGKITGGEIDVCIDSGFLNCGAGFFETLLYQDGRLFFPEDHLERLSRAADVFGFTLRKEWLGNAALLRLVRVNRLDDKTLRIKIICAPIRDNDCWDVIVFAKEYERETRGYSLFLHWEPKDGFFCNFKSIHYHPLLYWRDYYKTHFRADEVAFAGIHGKVLEAGSSNILYVKDHQLHYVDVHENYLSGVMQKNILAHADEIGFKDTVSVKGGFDPDALQQADELLLTNSLIIAQRVKEFHTGKVEQVIKFESGGNDWAWKIREYFLKKA